MKQKNMTETDSINLDLGFPLESNFVGLFFENFMYND